MSDVHIYKVERLRVDPTWPHERQRFFIRPGSRTRAWKFFDGADVPYFEGDCAWFEIERKQGRWVPAPGHALGGP